MKTITCGKKEKKYKDLTLDMYFPIKEQPEEDMDVDSDDKDTSQVQKLLSKSKSTASILCGVKRKTRRRKSKANYKKNLQNYFDSITAPGK